MFSATEIVPDSTVKRIVVEQDRFLEKRVMSYELQVSTKLQVTSFYNIAMSCTLRVQPWTVI